jgi:hypothetical protein
VVFCGGFWEFKLSPTFFFQANGKQPLSSGKNPSQTRALFVNLPHILPHYNIFSHILSHYLLYFFQKIKKIKSFIFYITSFTIQIKKSLAASHLVFGSIPIGSSILSSIQNMSGKYHSLVTFSPFQLEKKKKKNHYKTKKNYFSIPLFLFFHIYHLFLFFNNAHQLDLMDCEGV